MVVRSFSYPVTEKPLCLLPLTAHIAKHANLINRCQTPKPALAPMAICGRAAACPALILPSTTTTPLPSAVSVNPRPRQRSNKAMMAVAAPHASTGGAVLDKPAFDESQLDTLPVPQEGGDPGRLKGNKGSGSGDSYKVLLVDDARHTEQLVEKALPQVVPSITAESARQLFHESRLKGVAVVIVAVKEHAEFYAHMMVRQGLRSAIEPDSDLAS